MRPGQPEKRDSRQSRGRSGALRQPSKQTAPLWGLPWRVGGGQMKLNNNKHHLQSTKKELSLNGLHSEQSHDLVLLLGWRNSEWLHRLVCYQDLRRNQRRIAELNSSIRKLEDRNSLLADERNELVWKNDFSLTVSVHTVYISAFFTLSWLHPSSSPAEACSRVREAVQTPAGQEQTAE